ncbi:bifunctional Longin-like domain superfamily/Mu homology domain/Clathrin adaptor [Babesia duncani]|uniref:Bifunctional Longin-like domain superfamily/Mu homology domain/Clathrin adaptor n=1 Tax=Babesia duncani TaxID=323732 RepID=A0AAD9PJ11_9APIC|nr:bifunctional Longin-like domain superfamily/Mu homology domain/Clathrin adaptor [Babesia duncani]
MGGISGLYILDLKGRLIISRTYKVDVFTNVCDAFYNNVISVDSYNIKPVFHVDGSTFCWILHNGIYLICSASSNFNVCMAFAFLYRFVNILGTYFKHINEDSIKENFVIVYELLDEMLDNGYPQATEIAFLRELIQNNNNHLSIDHIPPTNTITNPVSWRKQGIKHKKNEIFLDVIESLDIVVSLSGAVLSSEIRGCLKMKSYLSGMPELYLGINDKVTMDLNPNVNLSTEAGKRAVVMEDIKFHQCVQLSQFESDRTITFIPPDGEFELMTYRLNCHVKPLFGCTVAVNQKSSTRIDFFTKAISQFKSKSIANNVEFQIPVPSDVNSPVFKASIGVVKYVPDLDAMVWFIKEFQGEKEFTMHASFALPSVSDDTRESFSKNPIKVKFEIPYFTVSGVSVRHLRITESCGYKALPWVRYITQNGDYQLRMT